jgi:hypothetical protein
MIARKLQIAAALALLGAFLALLAWQHRANEQLQAELTSLRQLAGENQQLRAENEKLAKSQSDPRSGPAEPIRPSAGPGTFSGAASGPARPAAARTAGERADVPLAAGLTPVASLGNAGRATPQAAWATQLWAARTGDVGLEASSITLGPTERAKVEALIPSLPADLRNQYDTPEKLIAFALAGSPHPVGGMQVLGETDQGPGEATLQTQWQHADDSIVHQSSVQLELQPDGWKMVVPASIVNRAVNYLSLGRGGP